MTQILLRYLKQKLADQAPAVDMETVLMEMLPQDQIEVTMRIKETSWPEDDPAVVEATRKMVRPILVPSEQSIDARIM